MKGRRLAVALALAVASAAADFAEDVGALCDPSDCYNNNPPPAAQCATPGGTVTIEQNGESSVLVKATGAKTVYVKDYDNEYYAFVDYVDAAQGMEITLAPRAPNQMVAVAHYGEPTCYSRASVPIDSWNVRASNYVSSDPGPPPKPGGGSWDTLNTDVPADLELFKYLMCQDVEECFKPTLTANYATGTGVAGLTIRTDLWKYGLYPAYLVVRNAQQNVIMLEPIALPTSEPPTDEVISKDYEFAAGNTMITATVLLPSQEDRGGNDVSTSIDLTADVIAEIEARHDGTGDLPWTSATPSAEQLSITAAVSDTNSSAGQIGRVRIVAPYQCDTTFLYVRNVADDVADERTLLAFTNVGSTNIVVNLDTIGSLRVTCECTIGGAASLKSAEIDVTNGVPRVLPSEPTIDDSEPIQVPTCTVLDEEGDARIVNNGERYTNLAGQDCICNLGADFCESSPIDDDGGWADLSTGMKALIGVLAAVLVLSPLVVGGFIFYRKRQAKKSTMNIKAVEMKPPPGPPPAESKV